MFRFIYNFCKMELKNLDSTSLPLLLKNIKLYKDLTKKLWNRWKKMFEKIKNDKSYYLVEYYPSVSEDYIFSMSGEVYKKVFWTTPSREEIVFSKKESILWGMKIYKDDQVVDLSFSKVEKELKK